MGGRTEARPRQMSGFEELLKRSVETPVLESRRVMTRSAGGERPIGRSLRRWLDGDYVRDGRGLQGGRAAHCVAW